MSTEVVPLEVVWDLETDGESDHVVCDCDEDLTLCGLRIEGPCYEYGEPENPCVVCDELQWLPCPRCGRA